MPLLLALLLTLAWAGSASAQAGFLQAVPGTARPTCTSITSPVTNQTWCADASGAPGTYLWKVWNGTAYVTVGGGGGGGAAIALNNQTWAAFPSQFFGNDANVTISSAGGVHTLGWAGCLPVSRGGIGICSGSQNALLYFSTPSSVDNSIVNQTGPNEITVNPNSSLVQTIQAGQSGMGAALLVKGGTATAGAGGSLSLRGGDPTAGNAGGGVEVFGRPGTVGGNVNIVAGGSTAGAGGFAALSAGAGSTVGGDAFLAGGTGAAGRGGDVLVAGSTGTGARGGNVTLTPGSGTPNGRVIINGLTWPAADGTAGQAIVTDGAGVLSFASGGTGTVTGSGAATQISVWTSATNITGFSDFTWDDANQNLNVGPATTIDPTAGQIFSIGAANTAGAGVFTDIMLGTALSDAGGVGGNTFVGSTISNVAGDTNTFVGIAITNTIGTSNFFAGTGVTNNSGDSNLIVAVDSDNLGDSNVLLGSSLSNTGTSNVLVGSNNTNTNNGTMLVGTSLVSTTDNALQMGVSNTPEVTITANLVELGQIGSPSVVLQFDGSTSGTAGFFAPATVSTPYACAWPVNPGNAGDVLSSDGNNPCQMAWIPPGGGGAGITSLNGLSAAVQTVAAGSTNINWSSAVSTHTFTWTGQLSNVRGGTGQDTSAWSALPLVTAGVWSQYAGSACPGGQAATSISATGVLTCSATGTGNVTHTGNLTLGVPIVGNGGADLKTMPGFLTNSVYYSTGAGLMAQETAFSYFDSQHTLVLGTGGVLPPTAAFGAPKLLVASLGEIGSNVGATGPTLRMQSTNGTFASPTSNVDTNVLGSIDFTGYDGATSVVGGRIRAVVNGVPGGGVVPTKMVFSMMDVGGVVHDNLTLQRNGNVLLGGKLVGYAGFGATDGALLIGNGAGGRWDANTLTAGAGISITNGPGTIAIAASGVPVGTGAQGQAAYWSATSTLTGTPKIVYVAAFTGGTPRANIQAAITAAGANGVVQFECNTNYMMGDATPLSVTTGLELRGCGFGGVTLTNGGASPTLDINSAQPVKVTGFTFVGGLRQLVLRGGNQGSVIVDNRFTAPTTISLQTTAQFQAISDASATNQWTFRHNIVEGPASVVGGATAVYGIWLNGSSDTCECVVAENTIVGFTANQTAAIEFTGAGDVRIENNKINGTFRAGIHFNNTGVATSEVMILGNVVSNNGLYGILFDQTGGSANLTGIVITGNEINNATTSAIAFNSSFVAGIVISGNRFSDASGFAINLLNVGQVTIDGNMLTAQTAGTGINIAAAVTQTTVGINHFNGFTNEIVNLGSGAVYLKGVNATLVNLGPASNGSFAFCTDCNVATSPCTSGGAGGNAIRQAGNWKCL